MKPIYRCEYCDFTGIEDEVKEHEDTCVYNYTKKSCLTCKHKDFKNWKTIECKRDVELPEGKMLEQCVKYEKDDTQKETVSWNSIFGKSLFGGLF